MSYSIQEFENKYLEDFKQLRLLEEEKKNLEYLSKQTKEKILQEMLKAGVKSIDNDFIKIMVTNPSESVSVDLKEFQKKEPVAYAELLEDYPKVTKRSESLRITLK
jgi:hypothetical protein|nr:MAG TPA: hypothetical protein [Caudoviricetes sp.]